MAVNDAEAHCQSLLDEVLPFAAKMLSEQGEFFPFGATIGESGEPALVAAYHQDEQPLSTELIRLLKDGFTAGARAGTYIATALAFDVTTSVPGDEQPCDAIAVSLNHRAGYSIVVVTPYSLVEGTLIVGESFAEPGEADIFPPAGAR